MPQLSSIPAAGRWCSASGSGKDKIARDHPELVGHLEGVIETIANPDHVESIGEREGIISCEIFCGGSTVVPFERS